MSLHADVAVPARDRRRLERLCRYVARPPLANGRLEELPDGRLALRLKTPWRDGTTHILMERHELMDRLVPLIPPPRAHQVRYHGVLAPCASARDRVVPARRWESEPGGAEPTAEFPEVPGARPGGPDARQPAHVDYPAAASATATDPAELSRAASRTPTGYTAPGPDPHGTRPNPTPHRPRRLPWAELLQRVFEVDALRCPRCGAQMRLVAAIDDPEVARRILACLDLPARAPPLGSARIESDENERESWDDDPPWTFDQRPPDDGDAT